jgi:hypothetical protein
MKTRHIVGATIVIALLSGCASPTPSGQPVAASYDAQTRALITQRDSLPSVQAVGWLEVSESYDIDVAHGGQKRLLSQDTLLHCADRNVYLLRLLPDTVSQLTPPGRLLSTSNYVYRVEGGLGQVPAGLANVPDPNDLSKPLVSNLILVRKIQRLK